MEQVKRELVTDAIAVRQVSEGVFCSESIWTPYGHPSAYGGQVMAQAVHAASVYAGQAFTLHSFQCYFLRTTSDAAPLKHSVYKLKEGRSFKTLEVRAFQGSKLCMVLVSSVQRPEPRCRPSVQWPMPDNVPLPEELELDMDFYLKQSSRAEGGMKRALLGIAEDRARIPLVLTESMERTAPAGYLTSMRWMKAHGAGGCQLSMQKVILAYMSDFDFIGVAAKALKLKRLGRGPGAVTAISTLNHSMHFYGGNLDCSDWVLFVTSVPCAGFGRATVLGTFYSRDGNLLAVAMQEGVLRAYGDERDSDQKLHGKL